MIWLAIILSCLIGFVIGVAASTSAARAVGLEAALELRELDANIDMLAEACIRIKAERDAAREALRLVPEVQDSPAWKADVPIAHGEVSLIPPIVEHASHAVAHGKAMRTCAKCKAPTTSSMALGYEWNGEDVDVSVAEACQSCEYESTFKVASVTWACMEAARAWEETRTAAAMMRSTLQSDLDLSSLDD